MWEVMYNALAPIVAITVTMYQVLRALSPDTERAAREVYIFYACLGTALSGIATFTSGIFFLRATLKTYLAIYS